MSDFNYTLYPPHLGSPTNHYHIQIVTNLNTEEWANDGYVIVQTPKKNQECLKVKLRFKRGNSSHIVHDFSIGDFPKNISNWVLEVEFVDENGHQFKDSWKSEMSEPDASPRASKGTEGNQRGMPRPPKK